jgi:hypothetical protein
VAKYQYKTGGNLSYDTTMVDPRRLYIWTILE